MTYPADAETVRLRAVPSVDDQLFQRLTVLAESLAEAHAEMDAALLLRDVEVACRASRRLASVCWLFREAADKHRGAA